MEKESIGFGEISLPVNIHSILLQKNSKSRGLHYHNAIEIVKIKSGSLSVYVNSNRLEIGRSQILFINSNVGHMLSADNAEIVYMQIDINLFLDTKIDDEFCALQSFILATKKMPYLLLCDNAESTDIFNKINRCFQSTNENAKWYLKAYLYELVAFMYSNSFIAPLQHGNSDIKKIFPVVKYINSNFKTPIKLEDICKAVGYNKYTVCHMFKSLTDSTVFEYINFLKIHYAAERLKSEKCTVLEIAADCGFSSASYFNKVFKKFIGCPPSKYKNNFRSF